MTNTRDGATLRLNLVRGLLVGRDNRSLLTYMHMSRGSRGLDVLARGPRSFFFFDHTACGILVPPLEIEPVPLHSKGEI